MLFREAMLMRMMLLAQDGFFYSYTYNLAATLQTNMEKGAAEAAPFNSMFVWNEFLTRHGPHTKEASFLPF